MKIIAFTPGLTVPSARFRVRQFIEPLSADDIEITEVPAATYPDAATGSRLMWAAERMKQLASAPARSRFFDGVLFQRELYPGFATVERWTRKPRLLDVDDAIHLNGGGRAARQIASICDRVVAGNAWLAEQYRRWNRDVVVLPTAVDTSVYRPADGQTDADEIALGWIGTSSNFVYLAEIEDALARAMELLPALSLKIVADRAPELPKLDPARWRFVAWNETREVAEIQSMDIGLMPLSTGRLGDWALGKCSFKMLQYMACGLPVVVSDVGMNAEVLAKGKVGIGLRNGDSWVDAICDLAQSDKLRREMGAAGRAVVERNYSRDVIGRELERVLRDTFGS